MRFGLISWLPIYLLETKGFNKEQMGVAFLLFEWAAIPSTLLAGYISDKIFKGYRMPPAIGAMAGYLIYIPQFLASVQTMEVVPAFAIGSYVGLRGFMSYVVGASLGTKAIGWAVDYYKSWNAGLIMLLSACVLCIFCSTLCHFSAKKNTLKNSQICEF